VNFGFIYTDTYKAFKHAIIVMRALEVSRRLYEAYAVQLQGLSATREGTGEGKHEASAVSCVGPSGGSRAAAAVTGGCREEVDDDSNLLDDSALAIPIAKLDDICPPPYALLSGGPARPLGYPRAETPHEKDPQTLTCRDCPRREGLPLGESEWGQTRAQLTRSTPTQVPLRPQHSVPQIC